MKSKNNDLKKKQKERFEKEKERLKKLEKKSKKKAKGFIADFKEFATKGNVIDMAVGVTVATAFTKIVNSLVSDIITPLLAIFTSKLDFSNLFVALDGIKYESVEAATKAGATVVNYGAFITNVVDFLIIALSLYIFLKIFLKRILSRKNKEVDVPKPTTKKCPYCLNDIPLEATRCGHCTSILEENL